MLKRHGVKAVKVLADEINSYIDKKKDETKENPLLYSVTHSWGGAVMQYAAQEVYKSKKLYFDRGIQTACPVPHEETSGKTYYFKQLFQFYSTLDLTQIMGSTATFTQLFGRKMPVKEKLGQDTLVWNIRMQDNGYELNHLNIKWTVMEYAPQLITAIEHHYPYQFDLDANIVSPENMKKYKLDTPILMAVRNPLVRLRPMTQQEEQFNQASEKKFQEIYGFSIHNTSAFIVKQLRTFIGSPWYALFRAGGESLGEQSLNEDKKTEGSVPSVLVYKNIQEASQALTKAYAAAFAGNNLLSSGIQETAVVNWYATINDIEAWINALLAKPRSYWQTSSAKDIVLFDEILFEIRDLSTELINTIKTLRNTNFKFAVDKYATINFDAVKTTITKLLQRADVIKKLNVSLEPGYYDNAQTKDIKKLLQAMLSVLEAAFKKLEKNGTELKEKAGL